jgi:cysteinyl-tRNA synthetase|uniref:cysteine--tRNA ligase n=1 Tax=Candidatus Planktophila sp. TaxID=2175601 RepID=UPI00404A8BDC
MKLYDTQSRQLKEIDVSQEQIRMYCCGPTVYRDAHVGNLRTFLLSDLIARVVRLNGSQPYLIQNITDVGHMSEDLINDDKMLSQAKLEKVDPFEIARKYEAGFHLDLAALNIQPAEAYPRASECIEMMLDLIKKLVDTDFAYLGSDGTVYFNAQKFASYGAISGNKLDSLKPGHRYEFSEEGAKRFHADWALWKAAGDRTEMVWDSPWGMGFPGWHIECSAMSLELLNGHVDIHVGGIDLRFPHHENERAQSNALINEEAVDLWVHGEHLLFEGRKMSKSSGNVVLLNDVIKAGIDPLAIRLCFLENKYRSQMDLTWNSIEAAHETLKRWRLKMAQWSTDSSITVDAEVREAFNTDLDTSRAILRLREIEKDDTVNKASVFRYADQVLGLDLDRPIEARVLTDQMKALLDERALARNEKRWEDSDQLRLQLENLGLEIKDTPEGQVWS